MEHRLALPNIQKYFGNKWVKIERLELSSRVGRGNLTPRPSQIRT